MELTAAHLDDCPAEGAQFVAEVEDKHFWFSARAALIQQHLEDELGSLRAKSVLDIGCGTGYVLGVLEKAGMVPTGCDMHQAALEFAKRRTTGELICIDANELKGSDFDCALLCDVIEHADDDLGLLKVAGATVRKGGTVLVTVPAHQWLWTPVDDMSGHKRRYTYTTLHDVMQRSGLVDVKTFYFNRLLMPIQALRKVQMRGMQDDQKIRDAALVLPPAWFNKLMAMAMKVDPLFWRRLPGASLIATGRVR
jgi:2-polyprenyl-3-methyl-5-hydroxy-6-metoxy-1,4-benzoquinol methylase